MIPKIIHYCWLSDEPIPYNLKKCINSWKKIMPNYKIKHWSTKNFDINSFPLVKQAYEAKKWAFAADYIRLYALYTEGGIYLDSDVMVYKNLDDILQDYSFISAVEYHPSRKDKHIYEYILDSEGNRATDKIKVPGVGIQAAILCSMSNHPFIKDCLNFYNKISLDEILFNKYTAPTVLAYHAEKYGYKYIDKIQLLNENMFLYSSKTLSNYNQKNKSSYAVHWCAGSWLEQSFVAKIKFKLSKIGWLRKMVYFLFSKKTVICKK